MNHITDIFNELSEVESKAREAARRLWFEFASPLKSDHWFLDVYGIRDHGLRVGPWRFRGDSVASSGQLLIPLQGLTDRVETLVCIRQTCGGDELMPGTTLQGKFFRFGSGKPARPGYPAFYFTSDFVGAAVLYEVTGYPTFCCFDGDNCAAVAAAIQEARERAGTGPVEMVFLPDMGEPDGLRKAHNAAFTLGGYLIDYESRGGNLSKKPPGTVWDAIVERVKPTGRYVGSFDSPDWFGFDNLPSWTRFKR